MTLLAVDMGNSAVKCGLVRPHDAADVTASHDVRPLGGWTTDREAGVETMSAALRDILARSDVGLADIDNVVVASVVPPAEAALADALLQVTGHRPAFAGSRDLPPILPLAVHNPSGVGADRICNAAAASIIAPALRRALKAPHGDGAIIVSLGTATTFDWVDATGAYRGGAIACGAGTAMRALADAAARLPEVPVARPDTGRMIGRTTVEQLAIGGWWGHLSLLRGMIARMVADIGGASPVVVATGGHAVAFQSEPDLFDHVDPHLTLRGLGALAAARRASESR